MVAMTRMNSARNDDVVRASRGKVLPAVIVEPLSSPPPGGRVRTVVFLHGWPDSPVLWEPQYKALAQLGGYRCISLPLSGYEATFPPRLQNDGILTTTAGSPSSTSDPTPTFDSAVLDVAASIKAYSTRGDGDGDGVILICHDWGCLIGYRLQRRFPELVERMVALDVGNDTQGLTTKELAFIVAYQAWLLSAYLVGGRLGDGMTTWFARFSRAPSLEPGGIDNRAPPPSASSSSSSAGKRRSGSSIPSARNWPYLRYWQEKWTEWRRRGGGSSGSGDGGTRGRGERESEAEAEEAEGEAGQGSRRGRGGRLARVPSCPLLYMHGADKPARFHGDRWIADVRASGGRVVEVENAGHWFQVTHADRVNEVLIGWLKDTAEEPSTSAPRQHRSAL